MELETNNPVSDEQRLLAQSKKLTLEPVHTDVSADDVPDAVIVGQHLAQGALANIDTDTEQNAAPVVAIDAAALPAKKLPTRTYILTGVGFLLLAAVITIVIIQL